MSTTPNPIDNAGALKALVVNLYTGWGYNAYRQENRDRADDQIIRNGVCGLLGEARAALTERISVIRRTIPAPSRQEPFPGSEQREQIAIIDQAGRNMEVVETLIRHLPVPENDMTWLRHRSESDFLPRLIAADEAMASGALQVRELARNGMDVASITERLGNLRAAIEARREIL
ncbi:hypothetical protein VSR34_36190 [Paraburkholderia sp. JHI2823]|uniref:hypothetical protein n=1 Tax=Paraburkholderia TaxID=1822464 RepID=UPI000415DD8C|nr:hypothetical protein [Paraburkholderia mimosarum]